MKTVQASVVLCAAMALLHTKCAGAARMVSEVPMQTCSEADNIKIYINVSESCGEDCSLSRTMVVSQQACAELCASTEGCVCALYRKSNKACGLKTAECASEKMPFKRDYRKAFNAVQPCKSAAEMSEAAGPAAAVLALRKKAAKGVRGACSAKKCVKRGENCRWSTGLPKRCCDEQKDVCVQVSADRAECRARGTSADSLNFPDWAVLTDCFDEERAMDNAEKQEKGGAKPKPVKPASTQPAEEAMAVLAKRKNPKKSVMGACSAKKCAKGGEKCLWSTGLPKRCCNEQRDVCVQMDDKTASCMPRSTPVDSLAAGWAVITDCFSEARAAANKAKLSNETAEPEEGEDEDEPVEPDTTEPATKPVAVLAMRKSAKKAVTGACSATKCVKRGEKCLWSTGRPKRCCDEQNDVCVQQDEKTAVCMPRSTRVDVLTDDGWTAKVLTDCFNNKSGEKRKAAGEEMDADDAEPEKAADQAADEASDSQGGAR